MERVSIVGSGGAGKSTFARQLAAQTGLPLVHLDECYWKPGWVETPAEEWRAKNRELTAASRWILDGNYGGTADIRLPRADTLLIFGLPRWQCVAGILRRAIRHHGDEIHAAGCPERLTIDFVRYVWRYPKDARFRLDRAIAEHGAHLRIVEFTSRRDAASFLRRLSASCR